MGKLTLTPDPSAVKADARYLQTRLLIIAVRIRMLKEIPEKAVIPANGYLVLARGKTDSDPISGVVNVATKKALIRKLQPLKALQCQV